MLPSPEEEVLRRHLGLDQSIESITKSIETSLKTIGEESIFGPRGICKGYPLRPMADRYFVAQEFNSSREDLRYALGEALEHLGVKPICADDSLGMGHILCKTSSLIQSTPFGVYQLSSSQNRNVYLELGIAIGMSRPFILVKDRDAEISPLALGLEYFPINSYLELGTNLGHKVGSLLTAITQYAPQSLPPASSQQTVFISHGNIDPVDFGGKAGVVVANLGMIPVFHGDPTGGLRGYFDKKRITYQILGSHGKLNLAQIVEALQTARFGIYRIEQEAAADGFLCLGISMALNRPGLLTHRQHSEVPSDVKGIGAFKFHSYTNLGDSLPGILTERFR